ncbi:MAG TPA: allophanate hydrolase subunit 1 [Candidatus Saccharimonadales bacterium]|nr:allophanate hydrolase subunit 1 [Candidatus Saccharimonadales bacterium]
MSIRPFGDRAFLVELEQRRDPGLVSRSRALADAWEARGLGPAIPAYASVVLQFDPGRIRYADARRAAHELLHAVAVPPDAAAGPITVVPVRYDGPDIAETAERSDLTVDGLIAIHGATTYSAWFLGFMPGFAYLGPLDPRIRAPRRPSPRSRVPAGAVAVADGQTAIYPAESPGGWQLIGSTDVRPFDPASDPPARIRAGDRVRFVRA